MLLQTNSYIVPKDKRAEHARLLRRFRASLAKLGCDSFEVYEQVGSNWTTGEPTGRYVQIMRFRDRRHQVSVQAAERSDPAAQAIIAEFCQLINFPYQQQQGLFAVGFYNSVLPVAPSRPQTAAVGAVPAAAEAPADDDAGAGPVMPDPAIDEIAAGKAEGDYAEVEDSEVEHEAAVEDAAGEAGVVEPPLQGGDVLDDSESNADEYESTDVADGLQAPDADAGETAEAALEMDDVGGNAPAASNGEATSSAADVDELGSLLDAHLESLPEAEGPHQAEGGLANSEGAGEEGAGGLDAMDLDVLDDLPDAPDSGPQHASKHVAR